MSNTIKEPPALFPISCGSRSDRGLLLYHFASVGKMLFYCPFYYLDYKKAVVDFLDEN